ncbi:MAG: HAD family hydrolase [Sedimentisphaerales bacterium]|nr:HAD family hydrolase [Sedimentisphaerales bacterium]
MASAAVFFDRDGTLIEDPGYLNHPDQVRLLDGVAEALKEVALLGYRTVVVSNQSAVARGIISEEMLERIHERLRELLTLKGASLDAVYYCPYHPDAVIPKYAKDSDWRKPQPGMLLAAAQEMDIDLTRSWMVGDKPSDVEAGRNAGCRTILIRSGPATHDAKAQGPDHIAVNVSEAVNVIKKSHRPGAQAPAGPVPETGPDADLDNDVEADEYTITRREAEEIAAGAFKAETPRPSAMGAAPDSDATRVLVDILDHLKRMQKDELYGEFSIMRLLAGIVQVFVPFCLLLALWLFMSPDRNYNSIFVALGFGAVLQTMALTFYIMQGRR